MSFGTTRDEADLGDAASRPVEAPAALIRIGHLARLDQDEAQLLPWQPEWREVLLGRGPSHRVHRDGGRLRLEVADEWMSAQHATIAAAGRGAVKQWTLRDHGSRNGVLWLMPPGPDGRRALTRVEERRLAHGDVLITGRTAWRFWQRPIPEPDAIVQLSQVPRGPTRSVSPAWLAVIRAIGRIATSALTVLVRGASGTGKEVVCRELHLQSGRRGQLVAVNCAALPEGMIEGQLFGHRRGAFTGAVEASPGLVLAADRGTLFLDEIGDMPLGAQAKLLRVLEQREVVPLGEVTPRRVDVRVVAATHVDLEAAVAGGRFRADLLARLGQVTLRLPSLAERREDLGALVPHFCGQAQVGLAFDAARALLAYDWPYNVRELGSVVAAAALLAGEERVIRLAHLPQALGAAARADERSPGAGVGAEAAGEPTGPAKQRAGVPTREELEALLGRHKGNVTAAAREVGKGKMQVYRWLERHGIDPARFR